MCVCVRVCVYVLSRRPPLSHAPSSLSLRLSFSSLPRKDTAVALSFPSPSPSRAFRRGLLPAYLLRARTAAAGESSAAAAAVDDAEAAFPISEGSDGQADTQRPK